MQDDALFCPECGSPVNQAQVNAVQANNTNNATVTENTSGGIKRKKSKAPLIAVITALIVVFTVLGVVILVKSNSPERRLQAQLDLGYKYLSELDYEQAVACFEAAIDIDSKNVEAYHGLIDAYVGMDDIEGVMSVCDMASENLSAKDRKDIERTVSSELSEIIEDAIADGDYNRAREVADNLSAVDDEASSKYIEQIADAGASGTSSNTSGPAGSSDPVNTPSGDTQSLSAVADSDNMHIMVDSFIGAYFGNSLYFYKDDFSYNVDSIFSDDWILRYCVSYYAMETRRDSYRMELLDQERWAENQNLGIGNVMSAFTSEQLDRIMNSFTGSYRTVSFDDSSYIPGGVVKYKDGYYVFAEGDQSYYYYSGETYADNYRAEKIGDKTVLYADVVVEDWNWVIYKAGEIRIELSENENSIFDGYSISKVSFSRTDLAWKAALNVAVEDTYTAINDCWRLDPALKNESIWEHLRYYFVQTDGDGIPDVVIDVNGPAAYINKYSEYTVLHYNGSTVDISLSSTYNMSFTGWTKYCYEDMLVVLSNGQYGWGMEKPNIYIYPDFTEQGTTNLDGREVVETNVNLIINGGTLTTAWPYPVENANSYDWHVYASEDGTVYDDAGNEYSYLFWEGNSTWTPDFSEGFCVKGEDTAEFLRDVLSEMGLTPREYNEFIVYWAPRMENNEYNLISFQGDTYTTACPLTITDSEGNSPANMLRVMMAWKSVDEEVNITPQRFDSFDREGFTVVEWGGRECSGY
jgi:tetratricopeptide (TPR) repeat protein